LRLLLDISKSGNGTTDDEDTGWHLFHNSSVWASITVTKEEFIKQFTTILRSMSSDYESNAAAFDTSAKEARNYFVALQSTRC
jgi:hypothetical protein